MPHPHSNAPEAELPEFVSRFPSGVQPVVLKVFRWLRRLGRPGGPRDYYKVTQFLRMLVVAGVVVRFFMTAEEFRKSLPGRNLLGGASAILLLYVCFTLWLARRVIAKGDWQIPGRAIRAHCYADVLMIACAHIATLRFDSDLHLGLVIPLLTATLYLRFDRTFASIVLIVTVGVLLPGVLIKELLDHVPALGLLQKSADWLHLFRNNLGPRAAFWCVSAVPAWWLIHRNRQLEESARIFRSLAAHIPYAVFCKNTSRRFTFANPVLTRQLGRTEAEMLGQTDAELGLVSAAIYQQSDEEVLCKGGSPYITRPEPNYARADSVKLVNTTKMRVEDETGRITGLVGICAPAVTEEEVAFYRNLLQRTPHAMFQKDREGRFQWVNESFCQIIARDLKEILDRTDYDLYEPELAARYRRCDEFAMEQNEGIEGEELHYFVNLNERRWVHYMKAPIQDETGAVVGIVGSFWDVHDSRMEDDRIRGWFVPDGRSPLRFLREQIFEKLTQWANGLQGAIRQAAELEAPDELVQRRGRADKIMEPAFDLLARGIEATDLLMAQFAGLAILRDGVDPEVHRWDAVQCNLALAVKAQIRLFKYLWEVRIEFLDAGGSVQTDLRKVLAALWVMVENGVRAVEMRKRNPPPGSTRPYYPYVRVSLQQTDQTLSLRVEDNGIGLSETDGTDLGNDALWRFHGKPGCGLRLLTRLEELSGGEWDFASTGRFEGATFTFRWPLGHPDRSPGTA